jgi:hypothetical protein
LLTTIIKMLLEFVLLIATLLIVFKDVLVDEYKRYRYKTSKFIGYIAVTTSTNDVLKIPCLANNNESGYLRIFGYMPLFPKISYGETKIGNLSVTVFEENATGPYPLVSSYDKSFELIPSANFYKQKTTIKLSGWIHNLVFEDTNHVEFNVKLSENKSKCIEEIEVIIPMYKYHQWLNKKRQYQYISSSIGN